MIMKEKTKVLVSGILAGFSIALGGTVFLSLDNKILGALFFTVGLFVVCTFGFNLFTGKICYVFFNNTEYAINLVFIWLGNFIGTYICAFLVRASRIAGIAAKAADMCRIKTEDSILSLFILGILCNIFIYIAVEGYNRNPHEVGKYLSLFFGVMVFILSGTEHCVADMFYFSVAHAWDARAFVCILVITAGNAVGGVIFPLLRNFISEKICIQKEN